MSKRKKIYLYGIINSDQKMVLPLVGLSGAPNVITIPYRDIALVASPLNIRNLRLSKENAAKHSEITRSLMNDYTLLPVSFGTVANNLGEIKSYLVEYYPQLKRMLTKFKNKIELGLKVFWRKEKFAEALGNDNNVKKIQERIENSNNKASYPLVLQAGELIENIANNQRWYYQSKIYEPLAKIAEDAALGNLIGETMVFNASFLMNKEFETDFDYKVNELYQPFHEILEFNYSGPWPPYNFTKLVFHKK